MKEMKRILSFVLCVVMLIGLLPIGVLAEETQPAPITDAADIFSNLNTTGEFSKKEMPQEAAALLAAENEVVDAAVIFTDLHTSSSNYKESTLKGIMTAIKNAGLPVSSVTSGGDAFSVNADSTKYTGKTSTLTGYIQAVLGNIPVNYVWSDHDRYAVEADGSTLLNKKSRLVYGAGADGVYGTGDDGNYYVYALSMGDLCSYDRYTAGFNYSESNYSDRAAMGFTSTVEQAIENFEADAAKLNKDRPLFIVSHQPLFDNRNDNAFAEDWFDSINEVAEDMDVAFFYGHNHNYDTGSDYYYAKGSSLPVATMDNWGWEYDIGGGPKGYLPSMDLTSESKTLNFTHMCAGYMAPSSTGSTSSTTREGVAVGIAIYDDEINYTTYNASGIYSGNYALNKTVKRDHAPVIEPDPTEPEETLPEETQPANPSDPEIVEKRDEATGIIVAASGITGITVSSLAADSAVYSAVAKVLKNSVGYDIEVADYTDGTKATVTLPIPAGVTNPAVYYVSDDGASVEKMNAAKTADGTAVTFTTDHFSYYVIGNDVNEATEGSVTIEGAAITESKTVYVRVNSLTNGGKYLIVNSAVNQALKNNNGKDVSVAVTQKTGSVTVGNTKYTEYIENPDSGAVWTAATNGNGFDLTNDGDHLKARSSNNDMITSNGSAWTYNATNHSLGADSYYVRYENNDWSNSKNNPSTVYLYKQETAQVSGGTGTVKYTMQASDLKHNVLGNNTTGQLDYMLLANGAAASLPAGGSYTFGVSGDSNGIISDISDTGAVSFSGNSGSCRVKVSYTWSQGGREYTVYKYVTVRAFAPSNYPEYPDEGAVKVSKSATGIDFQASGIAQVEISASGVPMQSGIDVIIMLDTSSSMGTCNISGHSRHTSDYKCTSSNGQTRAQILEESLANLITMFRTGGPNGGPLDINLAIANFNGYYRSDGTPYDVDDDDKVNKDNGTQDPTANPVKTGDRSHGAGAFRPVSDASLDNFAVYDGNLQLNYASGTNYDYAFDAIYQLGTAIKQKNEESGENRELYVIFMSDGIPFQWNYYTSQRDTDGWNNWLQGTLTTTNAVNAITNCDTHSYYYDLNDYDNDGHRNEHRMANAIKGDPTKQYEVIRKSTAGLPTGTLTSAGKTNLYTVPGLGAKMYSINFLAASENSITLETAIHAIKSTASDPDLEKGITYYHEADNADSLNAVFDRIGKDILYAANNARFVDKMGSSFNLQMETSTYKVMQNGAEVEKTLAPIIEILEYPIYTLAEAEASATDNITLEMVGDRKGAPTVKEVVMFSADGSKAYSNLVDKDGDGTYGVKINADGSYTISDTGDNIIGSDNVINAASFWFNNNSTEVEIEGVSIPTGKTSADLTTGSTTKLPAETFYWKMGTVKTTELAMRYYVYLDGSMEGTKEGGSYATNQFATLYYDNYLGRPCYKDTISPIVAWKEANVSYAFYLVNENGEIIVNQTTGQTGSFANKIAVTNPVMLTTVLLNNNAEVTASIVANNADVLPKYYTLYDNAAEYTVRINSNGTGSWEITKGTGESIKATTYVTDFGGNPNYSNALSMNETHEYTHTVVWFAVVWDVQAHPDTVVVDYGLPVDISVLGNDMFGEHGKLAAVGAYSEDLNLDVKSDALADGFGTEYIGTYGTAKANTADGEVRYTLNSMKMDSYEKFAYAVNYTGSENAGYYYDTVTVIPATTIYYEDGFLNYAKYNADGTKSNWSYEGTLKPDAAQDEDRPGKYALTDANNIYGYDSVNNGMTTFSMGQARKVHVDASSYATATFSFAGTGFDVISMTSNTTGTIAVEVKNADGDAVANKLVNTYYGYTLSADGKWVVATGNVEPLYQVPVLQIENLPYGVYDVKITATYVAPLDKTTADGYDLYLDAIRIYDPANDGAADGTDDTTIEDAYKADGEGWPSYIELRNKLIDSKTLGNAQTATEVVGLVFIDGDASVGDAQIGDYQNFGPNNEVYLAPGQRVAFLLNTPANVANVHIGIKSADGKTGTYTITNIAKQNIMDGANVKVEAGSYYNEKSGTISTTTDMYYDMTGWKGDIVVITNTGDGKNTTGVISLTNIKSTYKSDPNETVTTSDDEGIDPLDAEEKSRETYLYMTPAAATLTLRALNRPAEEDVPGETIPEETTPDVTEPEETIPEETVPETTVPEETEPETEATQPDATEPDSSEPELDLKPEVSKVLEYVVQKVTKAVSSLLKKWFR